MIPNKVDPDFLLEYLFPEEADPLCRFRLDAILSILEKGPVLDAGCGSGWVSRAISRQDFEVVSLDIDHQVLKAAKIASRLTKTSSELVLASITNLPFRDRAMGSVITSEVLEHIPDVKACLSEIARVLRERGVLAITIPSRSYNLTVDLLGKIFTSRHSRWMAKQINNIGISKSNTKIKTFHHIQHFTPSTIVRLLRREGFSIILFKNAYIIAHLIVALFLGFLGLKRKHIKGLLRLDLKLAEKLPPIVAGGYIIITRRTQNA